MITFPHNLGWQGGAFQLVGQSATAGFGLSGASTVASSNSAHWRCEFNFLVRGESEFHSWQAFIGGMRGALGTTNVPCKSRYLPFDGQRRRLNGVDAVGIGGTSFSDWTGFSQGDVTHAELASAGSLRDGSISVKYVDLWDLRAGHFISIGDGLHRVVGTHKTASDVAQVQIEPLLRDDYPIGERVVVDRPHCKMRFVDGNQGVLEQLSTPMQSISVSFVEVV